jgi:hypothetical protein
MKKIYDIDKSFALEIVEYLIKNEHTKRGEKTNMLRSRAKRFKELYGTV